MTLVEDILDLAKIEAGTFSLNEQLFSINTLVQDMQFVFEFEWTQKGIYFKVEIDEGLSNSSFCSDIGRIKQVLYNLISNAWKFTIQGGIILRINEKFYFDADSFERRKGLRFEVSDTGVGIPEKDIPKLFKLFGMSNANKSKLNSKGTGLGLAISKKIVESLGGVILLKSKLGVGTDITFTIKEAKANHHEVIEENSKSSCSFQ